MPALVHHHHHQTQMHQSKSAQPRRASAIPAFSSSAPASRQASSFVPAGSFAAAAGPRCGFDSQASQQAQRQSPQQHQSQPQQGLQQQQVPSAPQQRQLPQQAQHMPSTPQHHHHHQAQQPRQSSRVSLPPEFKKKYIVKDELGVGGSGHIFSAVRRSDGKEFAVKLIPSNRIPTNRWIADDDKYGGNLIPTEVYIMAKLHHPSLIQFIDYFPGNGVHLIVMELFGSAWKDSAFVPDEVGTQFPVSTVRPVRQKAMDLFELLEVRSLNEDESHAIFTQIVDGVHFMLQNGLVHGDIKDENVLVDWPAPSSSTPASPSATPTPPATPTSTPAPPTRLRPKAKLIDFGATISLDTVLSTTHDFHGTLEFAPPEILLGHLYSPALADAWSLGVLLYDMVSKGAMPFDTPEDIINPNVRPTPVHASAGCRDVLRGLLEKDPRKRMTVEQVVRHPWYLKGPKYSPSSAAGGKGARPI